MQFIHVLLEHAFTAMVRCHDDLTDFIVNPVSYTHLDVYKRQEYGGAPEKAVRSAFVSQIDAYLKQNSKYKQGESKISFQDVADCLIIVISSFSTRTSYENQTKKAITNRFIQEAMTDFLRHQLEVYFIENPLDAEKIAAQVLVNKRSREEAEKLRISSKKKLSGNLDLSNRCLLYTSAATMVRCVTSAALLWRLMTISTS